MALDVKAVGPAGRTPGAADPTAPAEPQTPADRHPQAPAELQTPAEPQAPAEPPTPAELQTPAAPAHDGTRPAPSTGRFPCFDGLRAIAALLVVAVHTAFVGGFTTRNRAFGEYASRLEIGVEVFFVISGFLLYRPFVAAHMSGRADPDRRRFWVRRLKRIIPAYWVAFVFATYVLRADSGGHTWYAPVIFLGFAQIYFPHYVIHGLSQAWSLDVEMTFYLMLPFYAALVGAGGLDRLRRRRGGLAPARDPRAQLRVELAGLAVLTALSYGWRVPLLILDGPHATGIINTMPNWLPGFLDQFALGMLLAVGSAYFEVVGRTPGYLLGRSAPWVCWGLALLAFVAVSHLGLYRVPLLQDPLWPSLARQFLYGTFAVLVVAPAVFGPQQRGPIRAFLRWRPMVGLGVVSYGIYLWHEAWIHMFLVWTGDHLFTIPWMELTGVVAALAVLSATASYKLVEKPVTGSRFADRRPSGPPPQPPARAAGMAAL